MYDHSKILLVNIFTILLICVFIFPTSTQAQNTRTIADSIKQNLAIKNLRDYRRQRLSVVVKTESQKTIEITGDRYYDVFGRKVTTRTIRKSGNTYKTWIPYKGLSRITEVEFFKTAGYPGLAQKARKYHFYQKDPFSDTGTIGLVGFVPVGALFAVGGAYSGNTTQRNVGIGFLSLGIVMKLLDVITPGGKRYDVGPPMRYPASQVHGIAGEYNQQLYQRLANSQSR